MNDDEGNDDDLSLRQELEAAFEASEKQADPAPKEPAKEPVKEPAGDEPPAGDKAPDDKAKEPAAKPDQKAAKEPAKPSYREPPSRWSKEAKEQWAKAFGALDETNPTHKQIGALRDMMVQRNSEMEADYTRKTQELAQQRQQIEGVSKLLEPRREAIERAGSTVERELGQLLQLNDFAAERPLEFVAWFAQQRMIPKEALAQALGLSPAAAPAKGQQQQQQSDPDADDPLGLIPQHYKDAVKAIPQLQQQIQQMTQQLTQVGSQWQGFQQTQQQAQIADARSQYQAWKGQTNEDGSPKHPFVDELQGEMASLLEKGFAKSYDEAYEKAVWANAGTRQKMLDSQSARQIADNERRARETAQRKMHAASGVTGSPASGAGARPPGGGGDSIRAILEAAYDASAGGSSI